jgi:cell division protein FtsA
MKLKYGSAYTDNNDIDNSLKYSIDSERQVESRKFIEIVEGRLEEIIENAWYQVPNEYYDKLLGGIIITGGTSNMPNIEKAFQNHTHIDKVRVAKSPIQTITGGNDDIKSKNAMMNTVIGLLLKGDMNCSGADIDPNGDLFSSTKPSVVTDGTDQRPARKASEVPTGVVRSEAEKQKAEEDARIKRDEEERKRQAEEAAAAAEAARIKRENSPWYKFKKGVLNFSKKMMEEEE